MGEQPANGDRLIARIAGNQHGVVATAQLRDVGIGRNATTVRVRAARLHRVHHGVYAVGHMRLSFEGRALAAVLACGEGAVVSHRSAGAIWGLLSPTRGPIDITVPGGGGRHRRRGIAIHRSPTLTASHTTSLHNVPVTAPPRTLRDLHRTVPQPVYRRALRKALDLHLIAGTDLSNDDLTRSELERIFLRVCRRNRLPSPEVNVRVGPYEVDFLWRTPSVIVETDGFRHHGSRASFESDRARDARLQALGYRVVRFTYRQVREEPRSIAAALRALLGPGGRGRGRS